MLNMLNMLTRFFAKEPGHLYGFLIFYTEKAESSSKELKLAAQL